MDGPINAKISQAKTALSAGLLPNTLGADFCFEALIEATQKFRPPEIMNTDEGYQFTSFDWTNGLKRARTKISVDGEARYLDNIFIERLRRSLKYECIYLRALETGSQGKARLGRWRQSTTTKDLHHSMGHDL